MKIPVVEIFQLLASASSIFFIFFILISITRKMTNQFKYIDTITKKNSDLLDEMAQVYLLMDTLANGSCSIMHKQMYIKLREMKPTEAIKKYMDMGELLKEISVEGYMNGRDTLKRISEETEDPIQKATYEKAIEKIDGIFNLLSTIDKDTPPEMSESIYRDIMDTVIKLRDDGIDLEMNGGSF